MMRKILAITMIMAVVMTAFAAQITYTNNAGFDIFVEGRWIEDGDTVIFDHYVYDDNLTFTSAVPDAIVLANEVVSTTDAATTVVTFTELADAVLTFDYDSDNESNVTMYFNETDTTSLTLDASWTGYEFNTASVYRLYFVTAQSTTAVADEAADGSGTSWAVDYTPIVPGTFAVTVDASSGSTTDDGSTGYISGVGTITYSTGALVLASSASTITADYNYYDEMNYTVTVKRVF